jgi:hypothetical protein
MEEDFKLYQAWNMAMRLLQLSDTGLTESKRVALLVDYHSPG